MESIKNKFIELDKIKNAQDSFDKNMKYLEKTIAENITIKEKIKNMKKDLIQAYEKINQAERSLNEFKKKFRNEE